MLRKERQRKVRSDKKHQIKASVNLELYESIYRLSTITVTPIKDIAVILIDNALENDRILKDLSKYLKRDIRTRHSLLRGAMDNEDLYNLYDGKGRRVSFTVRKELYEVLYSLAYGFGCSVSKVSSVLMYESITDLAFIEAYLENYLDSLNDGRKRELKQLLKYIQQETSEQFTLADLMAFLVEQPIKWILFDKKK